MSRIKIDVSKSELNYIREAIEHKHDSLMQYLEDCEEESQNDDNLQSQDTFTLSADRVRAMKDAGIWDDPVTRSAMIKKFIEFDRSMSTDKLRSLLNDNLDEGITLKGVAHPRAKKPHWTHTAKGKKILAARKRAKK